MKIAVTGSTGLAGTALVSALRARGDDVVRLVRRAAAARDEAAWDPATGLGDPQRLEAQDAVVHLAGENIAARRWSAAQKERIRASRIGGTAALARDLLRLKSPPRAFVGASAVGFYGATGAETVDETAGAGTGFLPEVCRAWEGAAAPLAAAGVRVAHLRFGVILSPRGGALKKMLLPFRLGVGGVVGSGLQGMSWISLRDAVGAALFALDRADLAGPINAVAPGACSNREFTKALGRALGRPTILPLPAFAARLAFGELADDLLLASLWVRPAVLAKAGFAFRDPAIDGALRDMVGQRAG
jgi:uncharacterized protein (TIGR01777 family)